MKITVIGAGYVGLVTASCFADLGNEVICVEKIESKIEKLRKGISPIYEPGLDIILKRNIENKRISFTLNMTEGINFSDIIFFCVGTPQGDDGKADLSQIEEASRQIAENLTSYKLIIEKSTVPVNTHQWIKKTILRYAKNNVEFDVASNPEFLREGSAIKDFLEPDRIVVGTESNKARNLFRELYKPFTDQDRILIFTTPATAELIKHASNSFLSLKISYINMVSDLCEKVGADVSMVAEGMGLDKRIGRSFLNAGIGYGGSCFPKDVKAFIKMAKDNGVDFSILEESEKVNKNRRVKFIEKIENILWINKDKNITIWGLSFKPNTDDIREAPSIDIVKQLNSAGANLRLYDPEAAENFKNIFPESDKLRYFSDMYGALEDSDALIILTEWEHFISANLEKIKNTMKLPIIIDGRNIFDESLVESYGFEYYSIGR
ncbi:MAG TPA: UDP-glucose/GDP-mannose dehydrogenase family protein [Spirochaetota bacterium]|nr:MAG: UDP-glucose 6-dehydrogenase TuaD [Spirochaetes bacterium ADurb.Bin133]HNZ26327.1 UDP-glucose/GDP-mannose dehydrogenase family protein [Spirochaetota bacterium]HPY88641.1 UDP-glucose/GDP-mannose dehydrogenase family protein [Spirochaetota bacterium]HQB61015.1 UDP-glucose/GDP-mannose dehydrogenase family protein [Spirochaetota bacterium]